MHSKYPAVIPIIVDSIATRLAPKKKYDINKPEIIPTIEYDTLVFIAPCICHPPEPKPSRQ